MKIIICTTLMNDFRLLILLFHKIHFNFNNAELFSIIIYNFKNLNNNNLHIYLFSFYAHHWTTEPNTK